MAVTAGSDADRLAHGALLQQGAQVVRMAGGLIVLTIVARRLSLPELGTYALLLSLVTYVQFVKSSVMNAAVIAVAEADGDRVALERVVSTGIVVYAALGVGSGALLAGGGLLALPVLNVPASLLSSAHAGIVGLALVTAVGWPVQIFDDLLRGRQRFAAVSALEIAGLVAYVAGALALLFADAPIWSLVTWAASVPLVTGLLCLAALGRVGERVRVHPRAFSRAEARRFGAASGLLALGGIADLAVFSLDRAILSGFRSPTAVGRYEGPLQMHSTLRYLHGVLTAPVVPAAAGYVGRDDRARLQELFVRGLRYTLVLVCPFAVVLALQAGPIMVTWLGPKFSGVADAAAVFVGWWLLGANLGMAGAVLYAARRFGLAAVASWAMAAANLLVTVLCTPRIGLYGPIAGALTGFAVQLAILLPAALRLTGVPLADVARRAWMPAYACAGVLAGALLAAKQLIDLSSAAGAIASLVAVPVLYWGLFALVFADADERALAVRLLLPVRQRRA